MLWVTATWSGSWGWGVGQWQQEDGTLGLCVSHQQWFSLWITSWLELSACLQHQKGSICYGFTGTWDVGQGNDYQLWLEEDWVTVMMTVTFPPRGLNFMQNHMELHTVPPSSSSLSSCLLWKNRSKAPPHTLGCYCVSTQKVLGASSLPVIPLLPHLCGLP